MADFLSNPNTIVILCGLLGFAFANMLSKNLIMTIIKVKLFKQGNAVIQVAHNLEDYFTPGTIEDKSVVYLAKKRKDNPAGRRTITADHEVIGKAKFRAFGCDCVMVDDIKNSLYIRHNGSYASVGGFNAEAMSEIIDTALKKPPEDETAMMPLKTFQLIVIVGIVGIGIGLWFVYKTLKQHDANTKMIYDVVVAMRDAQLNVTAVPTP